MFVNVTLSSFFQSFRVLRQGDPLSPNLFMLAMDLNSILKRVKEGGNLLGFKVRRRGQEGMEVPHL